MTSHTEKSTSAPSDELDDACFDERGQEESDSIALPSHVAGSGTLDRLFDTARDYARAAGSENTLKAYAKDWAHFARWCRMKGAEPLSPSPEMIYLYLADLASGSGPFTALSVSAIDRRLSGLAWNYAQRGFSLRKDRHIATVRAGIKRKHPRPPVQKAAILANDILAMVATLPYDLCGLRDRAFLLLGFAGEIFDKGALLTLNERTGWREVEIGRGTKESACPVHALEQWLHFVKIDFGPVFVGTSRDGKRVSETRLNDKHVARLIKRTVLDAGIRSEMPEKERLALLSGHSLRAGLASSAETDERYVHKHLVHASAKMTRRYHVAATVYVST